MKEGRREKEVMSGEERMRKKRNISQEMVKWASMCDSREQVKGLIC